MKLAILSTHPIQYHSQWYTALAKHPDVDLHVFYCYKASPQDQARAGFGVEFDWDIPLLSGYSCSFLQNVATCPAPERFSGLDTPEIKDVIESHRFDAVMVNGWHYKSAWQAIRSCWKSKVKVLVRSDSHLHTSRALPKRLAKEFVYRQFIPRFDACLGVGTWSREYFLHYGARAERVFVVPHAVDNDFFSSEALRLSQRRTELRRNWGLDERAVVFAFAGKFVARKRCMDFVRAIGQATRTNPSVQGLMVGDGPLRAECERVVAGENLPVKFTGFLNQSEISAAYVACDALVLPSDGLETWGLVVNEAMACGRPCIVSNKVGCGPDLIVSGETGGSFTLGDVSGLASRMLGMAADPERMARMGTSAKRKINNYSVSVAVGKLVESVHGVLNASKRNTVSGSPCLQ